MYEEAPSMCEEPPRDVRPTCLHWWLRCPSSLVHSSSHLLLPRQVAAQVRDMGDYTPADFAVFIQDMQIYYPVPEEATVCDLLKKEQVYPISLPSHYHLITISLPSQEGAGA